MPSKLCSARTNIADIIFQYLFIPVKYWNYKQKYLVCTEKVKQNVLKAQVLIKNYSHLILSSI